MINRWPLILLLLLIFAPASATDLSLTYKAIKDNVAYNEAAKYTITVTNNQNKEDRICLKTPDWGTAIFSDYIISLAAKSSGKVQLSITPPADVYIGQYAIEVSARSCDTPSVSGSVLLKVNVNSELPHIEPTVDLPQGLRPHEYTMNVIVKNAGASKVGNLRGVVGSDLFAEQSFDIGSLDAQQTKVALQTKVDINPKATIGPHIVYVTIYQDDKIIKKYSKKVDIVSEENIFVQKVLKKGIISKTYIITLENKGNLAVDDFYIEKIPSWKRLFLSTNPKADIDKVGKESRITWFYSLAPTEKTSVTYTVSYLPILIILIILGVVAYGLSGRYTREFVLKKSIVKEGKDLKVKVSVKNVSSKQITNVTVSDFIPTPLKLVKEFGTLNPNVIKKEDGAVKVIWKFDVIYPNEERLLVYGLKTALGIVGTASLPAAELRFKKEDKQKAFYSNTVAIKGKVSVAEE